MLRSIQSLLCLIVTVVASSTFAQSNENGAVGPAENHSPALGNEFIALLDHTAFLTAESGLPTSMLEEIDAARSRVLGMPPEAFAEIEPYVGDMVRGLRHSAEERVDAILNGETYLRPNARQKNGQASPLSLPPDDNREFPDREHFSLDWSFETETPDSKPGDGSTSDRSENGTCRSPGPSNKLLIDSKRQEIIAFSLKVVAERFCEQTVAGINFSVACIPSDIIYYAFHAISESQQMCSSLIGRTYVDAVFDGGKHIHDQLGNIDSGVKSEIKSAADQLMSRINLSTDRIINEKLEDLRDATTTSIEESGQGLEESIQKSESRLLAQIASLNQEVTDTSNEATSDRLEQIDSRSDSIDAELDRTKQFIEQFERENRRVLIEANLAEQGRPVNGFAAISSFQQEDLISEVSAIVRETISRMMAAGEKVNNAESNFFTASSMLSAGDYQAAYKWFGLAYQAATQ